MKYLYLLLLLPCLCLAQVQPVIPNGTIMGNASGSPAPATPQTSLPSGVVTSGGGAPVGTTDSQTLSNKTISCASNTLTGLGSPCINFDVTAYGAKCDSSTDDTTAIQAAITAAEAKANAAPHPQTNVVFPAGGCVVASGSLLLSSNDVSMTGAGEFATTLIEPSGAGSNFDLLNMNGGGFNTISNMGFKNFNSANTNYAINNINTAQVVIDHIQIQGFFNGIQTTSTANTFIANNLYIVLANSAGVGVTFNSTGQVLKLTNSIITGPTSGAAPTACVKITGGAAYDLSVNDFEHCGYALWVPAVSTGVVSIRSTGNWYDTSTNDGVLLDGTTGQVSRVTFTGDWFASSSAGSGLEIKGAAKGIQIDNGQFFDNAVNGITFDSGGTPGAAIISNSQIAENTGCGISVASITGSVSLVNDTIGPAADFTGNGTNICEAQGGTVNTTAGTLSRGGPPFIWPSSGSMGNNGALTLNVALPRTIASAFIYMVGGAISSGSAAGWYYATCTSGTACTVFNNTYTGGQPITPASPTAFATTGPGIYAATGSQIDGPQITIPANTLGAYGQLNLDSDWSFSSTSGSKGVTIHAQGSSNVLNTNYTTSGSSRISSAIVNQGSQSVNMGFGQANQTGFGALGGGNNPMTINFGASQVIAFAATSTTTDYIICEWANMSYAP